MKQYKVSVIFDYAGKLHVVSYEDQNILQDASATTILEMAPQYGGVNDYELERGILYHALLTIDGIPPNGFRFEHFVPAYKKRVRAMPPDAAVTSFILVKNSNDEYAEVVPVNEALYLFLDEDLCRGAVTLSKVKLFNKPPWSDFYYEVLYHSDERVKDNEDELEKTELFRSMQVGEEWTFYPVFGGK